MFFFLGDIRVVSCDGSVKRVKKVAMCVDGVVHRCSLVALVLVLKILRILQALRQDVSKAILLNIRVVEARGEVEVGLHDGVEEHLARRRLLEVQHVLQHADLAFLPTAAVLWTKVSQVRLSILHRIKHIVMWQ